MKVWELIKVLEKCQPEMEVCCCSVDLDQLSERNVINLFRIDWVDVTRGNAAEGNGETQTFSVSRSDDSVALAVINAFGEPRLPVGVKKIA